MDSKQDSKGTVRGITGTLHHGKVSDFRVTVAQTVPRTATPPNGGEKPGDPKRVQGKATESMPAFIVKNK